MEVIEDEKDRGEEQLDDGDEEEVGEDFGEEEFGAGGGSHALGVEDLMADFAGPGLIEGADRGEHGGHAEDAAGDFAGECAAGVEGDGEEDDDQQGEEEHGVDGFAGAPLDAEVFDEMGPEGAGHLGSASVEGV